MLKNQYICNAIGVLKLSPPNMVNEKLGNRQAIRALLEYTGFIYADQHMQHHKIRHEQVICSTLRKKMIHNY